MFCIVFLDIFEEATERDQTHLKLEYEEIFWMETAEGITGDTDLIVEYSQVKALYSGRVYKCIFRTS